MNSYKPSLPLRRSVLLIGAAILISTTTQAQTKPAKSVPQVSSSGINIGRLPSFHAGDGQVVGAKPNVFIIIDNGMTMGGTGGQDGISLTPKGNLLQQTAAGLIAALPQLEGKVRLGYSTIFPGREAVQRYTVGGRRYSCGDMKLNGNVSSLNSYIGRQEGSKRINLEEDLKIYNPAYLEMLGKKSDFIFGNSGSGFGEIVPRDFSGNIAKYVYAWLGAMCPGNHSEGYISNPSVMPNKHPPYGDLSNPTEYVKAAAAANNTKSYSLRNWGSAFIDGNTRPIADGYAQILAQISDKEFTQTVYKCRNRSMTNCSGGLDLSQPGGVLKYPLYGQVFDSKENRSVPFLYDSYAPTSEDRQGFPLASGALSCRKNYAILISQGDYGAPNGNRVFYNQNIGTGGYGINGDGWTLPIVAKNKLEPNTIGIDSTSFPLTDYTRMYRFLRPFGINGVTDIEADRKGGGTLSANRRFLLGKLALRGYYNDLRNDLVNDVPAFYVEKQDKTVTGVGGGSITIPKEWNRKNDVANWQHLTTFALGFKNGFRSWQTAAATFAQNYPDVSQDDGILEPYFKAIEDGSIYNTNKPLYDWGRGQYALANLPRKALYIFKDRQNNTSYIDFPSGNFNPLGEMDYAKMGVIGRGGAYDISDYESIRKVISMIATRIETAMAQGISGGAISGGGRVTASQQAAGGNDSILFTTYLDQEYASGNIFAFKNCPLIKQMIPDENGGIKQNPDWDKYNCGKRLWNAASALYDNVDSIGAKTIVPVENGGQLSGATFDWNNLDQDLKAELSKGGDETLGQARVEWLNGKLQSQFAPAVASKLRARGEIFIPNEKEHYKRKPDGTLEKDQDGNLIVADPTNIPNLMGDVVYALPKAVDNRGTLPAAHPLHNQTYLDFLNTVVKNRKPLVLAGSNDGRLYGFSVARRGASAAESENAALAFSYIPRQVITKPGDNLVSYTTQTGLDNIKGGFADGLVNGPFTVRDVQVNGQWKTYVVGTLGEGGDAIYALDISNGRASPNMFKWEVSGRGYGNIMAEPRVVWLRAKNSISSGEPTGKWVILLPTGYNAETVSLIVLDLADGRELAKINTFAKYTDAGIKNGAKTCTLAESTTDQTTVLGKLTTIGDVSIPQTLTCDNGLGQLTVFDADSDSGADFVFAGDLLGHVWKFDLTGFFDSTGNQAADLNSALKVAYNSPLFIAQTPIKGGTSTRQPITSMIEIDDGAYGEGSMLYFGTGRMLNQQERQLKQQESFYGVWDIPRYSEQRNIAGFSLPLRRNPILANSRLYDFIRYETFVIPASKVAGKQSSLKNFKELRGVKRIDSLNSSKYLSFNLEGKNIGTNKVVGWIIDFPSEDSLERVINRSYSFEDNLFFPTFSPKGGSTAESCSPIRSGVGGDARFYMVDRLTGGQLEKSPFDFDHDGTQDDPNGKDGVKVRPDQLGKGGDLNALGYNKKTDKNCDRNPDANYNCEEGTLSLSPAGILIGSGGGDFLSVTGILERSKQATDKYNCDYSRQVVFPSTVDPVTGNPLILSSCNRNRYRVWKQPVIE